MESQFQLGSEYLEYCAMHTFPSLTRLSIGVECSDAPPTRLDWDHGLNEVELRAMLSEMSEIHRIELMSWRASMTTIDAYALSKCRALRLRRLPPNVTEIGIGAFGECVNLDLVELPNTLRTIYRDAFKDCVNLYRNS